MLTLTTILKQKTHIIYGVAIILLASVAFHFFRKPAETITKVVTKVETKVQTVDRIVNKDKVVYVDRTITTKKQNGDVIIEVDRSRSKTNTKDREKTKTATKTKETETTKTVTNPPKAYSVEALVPINPMLPSATPNFKDTQVNVGMRIFDSPISAVAGTTPTFNTVHVGLRVEF